MAIPIKLQGGERPLKIFILALWHKNTDDTYVYAGNTFTKLDGASFKDFENKIVNTAMDTILTVPDSVITTATNAAPYGRGLDYTVNIDSKHKVHAHIVGSIQYITYDLYVNDTIVDTQKLVVSGATADYPYKLFARFYIK